MATLREQTLEIALKAFVRQGFNQTTAAESLGISRGCLRMLLSERLGVTEKYGKEIIDRGLVQELSA